MVINVIKKHLIGVFAFTPAFCLTSCDSGNIYPETGDPSEGRTVNFSVKFTDVENWPSESRYVVCFACYKEGSTRPEVYHDISKPSEGQEVTYKFKNLSSDVTTFAITLARKSHKHVYNIYSEQIPGTDSKSITISALKVQSLFSYVQTNVFDARCTSCHGDGWTSAGLDLREGKSYDLLVGHAAVTDPTRKRVVNSDAASSYIVDILTNAELPANINGHTNHPTTVMVSDEQLSLVKEWINSGAEE